VNTFEVTIFGHEVKSPDLPEYDKATVAIACRLGRLFFGSFGDPFVLGFPSFASYLVRGVCCQSLLQARTFFF
jgi:hypothetical protein